MWQITTLQVVLVVNLLKNGWQLIIRKYTISYLFIASCCSALPDEEFHQSLKSIVTKHVGTRFYALCEKICTQCTDLPLKNNKKSTKRNYRDTFLFSKKGGTNTLIKSFQNIFTSLSAVQNTDLYRNKCCELENQWLNEQWLWKQLRCAICQLTSDGCPPMAIAHYPLFSRNASKQASFPDHFLPNCFQPFDSFISCV